MRILLYGINYWPELTATGKYTGEFARYLVEQGHEVRVVTASPYYPEWCVHPGYSGWKYRIERDGAGVKVFRCPLYVPSRVTTTRRLMHLLSFALSSLPVVLGLAVWRPKIVLVVEPTFFCTPAAAILSLISGAKSILHIQDYELDAVHGLGLINAGMLIRLIGWFERSMMRFFDRVSTISRSMMELAVAKGVDRNRVMFFPNWVDTTFITANADGSVFREEWGISENDRVVLYSGNLGEKQGLEIIPDVALAFSERLDVRFVVVGEGAMKTSLVKSCEKLGVKNVQFRPLQPFERLPELLAMADVHLVLQRGEAADVVLPSKLTSILAAAGHALVTAAKGTEMASVAEEFPGIFRVTEPDSAGAVIRTLEEMLEENTSAPNMVAREYALRKLETKVVLGRVESELRSLARGQLDGQLPSIK